MNRKEALKSNEEQATRGKGDREITVQQRSWKEALTYMIV
jgi:hypothetical protein